MSDKEEDRFFRELLRETGGERAPDGFADSVMERIRAERVIPAKPLVSTTGWIVFAGCALGLLLWAGFGAGATSGIGWYGDLIGWLDRQSLPTWEGPQLPDSLTYGALALMIFGLLHVIWLRRYVVRGFADRGFYSR